MLNLNKFSITRPIVELKVSLDWVYPDFVSEDDSVGVNIRTLEHFFENTFRVLKNTFNNIGEKHIIHCMNLKLCLWGPFFKLTANLFYF